LLFEALADVLFASFVFVLLTLGNRVVTVTSVVVVLVIVLVSSVSWMPNSSARFRGDHSHWPLGW
jgi:hypothetical protein